MTHASFVRRVRLFGRTTPPCAARSEQNPQNGLGRYRSELRATQRRCGTSSADPSLPPFFEPSFETIPTIRARPFACHLPGLSRFLSFPECRETFYWSPFWPPVQKHPPSGRMVPPIVESTDSQFGCSLPRPIERFPNYGE